MNVESKKDYYEVLGVEKNASDADIKSAFRKKAKTCHPDLHPGDAAKEAATLEKSRIMASQSSASPLTASSSS